MLKWRLLHKCVFVNFTEFLRIRFYITPPGTCMFKYYGRVFKSTLNAWAFDYEIFFAKQKDDVVCILEGRFRNRGIFFHCH